MEENKNIKAADRVSNNGADGDQDIESVPVYRKKRILIPLFVLIVLAGIGWYWYMGTKGYESTDDAFIDGDKATISSKILGRITKLAVAEGDTVKAGDALVMLDTSDLKAQEKQASAAIINAQESISLAKVNMEKAKDDFQRAESQLKNDIITKEQYDHSLRAFEAAQAEYNISLTRVGTAKAQLGVVETQLQNGRISSPMNGVVAKRWVLEGDIVQPGQPIFTIYDTKNVWVTAQFEETKLHLIAPGDQVEIDVDAYPESKFAGKVLQIGSNTASQFSLIPPNNASGNFTKVTQRVPVKISIAPVSAGKKNSAPSALLPGMSVEVKVRERK